MAVISSASLSLRIPKSSLLGKKHVNKVVMAVQNRISGKQTSPLCIGSPTTNKIFEDQTEGIVCYIDESGEITCEGYDEGPRFCKTLPNITYHRRDVEIIDLLQRNWIQIVNKGT